jgi:hypothetical protein
VADENRFRIALAQADLPKGFFHNLGIPRPNCVFRDYSILSGQSTGYQTKQGYNTLTLSWQRLTRFHVHVLESYQRQVSVTELLYLTVDRTDGLNAGTDWFNVSGKPHVITYTPEENSKEEVLTGVTWFINDVVIIGAAY